MRIWIDLVNSPQVLFCRPLIAELERRGHETVITTRPFAQTIELADQFGMVHTPFGMHGGRNFAHTLWYNWLRSSELVRFVRDKRIDLAVSHNAYSQIVAARRLGIPSVTAMDYEHQPINHLAFRLASLVIVPECFPSEKLRRYGAGERRVMRYPGVKEQIYLGDFRPMPGYARQIGLPEDRVIVVLRPPADWAAYHRMKNELMDHLIRYLGAARHAFVVFLPRIHEQRAMVEALRVDNFWIPDHALDGPNLMWAADLVISAGGTMNREAAVLGTPAYTVFAAKLGAVDRYLVERDRLHIISSEDDFPALQHLEGECSPLKGSDLINQIVDAMLATVGRPAVARAPARRRS